MKALLTDRVADGFCRNDREQSQARSALSLTIANMSTSYIRWAVYIGDKPAPINSTPPISTYQDADLFARDISQSIGDTGTVSVVGFTTPRSDKTTAGDVLARFRAGEVVK